MSQALIFRVEATSHRRASKETQGHCGYELKIEIADQRTNKLTLEGPNSTKRDSGGARVLWPFVAGRSNDVSFAPFARSA